MSTYVGIHANSSQSRIPTHTEENYKVKDSEALSVNIYIWAYMITTSRGPTGTSIPTSVMI